MIDAYHSNARRKPNTKEYDENFNKIDWKQNKLNWEATPEERKICQKRAKKASQWLKK